MNNPRQLIHKLVALVSWLLLALMWWLLVREHKVTSQGFISAGQTIAILIAATVLITLTWVRHNLRIYRQKGPRKGRPYIQPRTDVDRLGRQVFWECDFGHAEVLQAAHVVIELTGNEKRYTPQHLVRI